MSEELYLPFIKAFFMFICTIYIFFKIRKCKKISNIKIILILAISIITAIIYSFLKKYTDFVIANIICYFLLSLLTSYILNISMFYTIILMIISLAFTFVSLAIATIISFSLKNVLVPTSISAFYLLITGIIQFLVLYLFFRIKRFKDGFSFFQEQRNARNIGALGIIVSILIIIISILYGAEKNLVVLSTIVLWVTIASGCIFMLNWVRKKITEHYKREMRDRTVEVQAEQLKEKDEIIAKLNEELSNVLKINHKYNHRISAVEAGYKQLLSKLNADVEFGEMLDLVEKLSKEYKDEVIQNTKHLAKLESTNVYGIDNILSYMQTEAYNNNIDFGLKINDSISYMVDKIIPQNKLETLIGDHIRDSIIAINCNNSDNKKILVMLGLMNGAYEFSVYDSGIEFEINTLMKLGLEQVTTHKDDGGTGIGFMTTFETLKTSNASLIIEEYEPSDTGYSKAVIIRFDGKNEYKVRSYRACEIRAYDKDNRIIAESLE